MRPDGPKLSLRQPRKNPLRTLAASRDISFSSVTVAQAKLLANAFTKAEVGLCGYATTLSVDKKLETDFLVRPGQICLGERAFSHLSLLVLHVRHAIELLLWLRCCGKKPETVRSVSIALLAALTTTKFYLQLPLAERKEIAEIIPEWLKESADAAEMLSEQAVLNTLAPELSSLLKLQGNRFDRSAPIDQSLKVASQYAAVANPTELILTQQGDERLLIDPSTGLNKYGCSPRPRPDAITFSSCTASSVSQYAYRETELLRHRLMQTLPRGNLAEQYKIEIELVRDGLRKLLDLKTPRTEVILSSSGTDAELYPLVLLRTPGKKLVNIIVAPDEVGTGTMLAAGGRHFSAHSPLGKTLRRGEPVLGVDADSIEVVCIPIRKNGGTTIAEKELKEHIASAISEAAKSADRIFLHLVDNTKTGAVAPDTDFVLALQKTFGSKLRVVVDACQFRLEKSNLHRYLAHGFCVLITGSKFFTGPPFCGALLIPGEAQSGATKKPFPRGFADYFTRDEVPPSLQSRAQELSPALNLGLLFRWTGALKEMKYFYSVASAQRTEILKTFRYELINSISANADLHLLECPPLHRWEDADLSLWDALPTIFSFAVRDPKSASMKWLRIRDLKKIYYLLNRDCSRQLPDSAQEKERELAAQKCHIGQPVTISRCAENGETGALRIACGARLVYGITYDIGLGKTPRKRFARELTDARAVLAKVSLILKYWENLCADGVP
jgi:hypothetical protein